MTPRLVFALAFAIYTHVGVIWALLWNVRRSRAGIRFESWAQVARITANDVLAIVERVACWPYFALRREL